LATVAGIQNHRTKGDLVESVPGTHSAAKQHGRFPRHEALLEPDLSRIYGKWQGAIWEAEGNRPDLRGVGDKYAPAPASVRAVPTCGF
jgi:hypothetical protein